MEKKETQVYDLLKKSREPLKQGDLANLTGIDSKELTKIINNLKKEGKITSPKRCFYSIA